MILDIFSIIFQANTDSVTQSTNRAKLSADDLTNKLKNTDEAASKVGGSLKQMAVDAGKALAGMLAARAIISGTFDSARDIAAIDATANAIAEAIGNVDAFGKASVALGGDAQGARDSLTDMAEAMGEAMADIESGRAKAFAGLKISLKDVNGQTKGPIQGMLELAGAVENLDRATAVFKIKELGITDNRTVEMLLKGRKELELLLAKQKEQGVLTKENAARAREFNSAWGVLSNGLDTVGTKITTALMPAFTAIANWLSGIVDWVNDHSDAVIGFFGSIAAAVTIFYLPAMISAAAATLAATWPLLLIIGIIAAVAAAFALVYEDIMAFIEGNDSLIGQILEKYPFIKEMIMAVIEAFKVMGIAIAAVWNMIIDGFSQMIEFVMRGIDQIRNGVATVASFFGIGDGEDGQAAQDGLNGANGSVAAANGSGLNSSTSNAISNSNAATSNENRLSIGELNVNAPNATDAGGVAKGVGGALDEQLSMMQGANSTGISR